MSRLLLGRLLGAVLCLGIVLPAAAQDGYTQTRHPIVLVHGLFGFDALGGVVDYWFGIPSELRAGGATVYVVNLSSANSNELRGEQLIAHLEHLQALHGHTRFNLIGHSQGGPTARYVASVRPDLVASMTSMGGPHAGSDVADALTAVLPPDSPLRPLVAVLLNAVSALIEVLSGDDDPQDAIAALESLSAAGAAAFNASHPEGQPVSPCGEGAAEVNGIRYYSFGGTEVLTNIIDPSDAAMLAGSVFFGSEPNDGLVGRCSSHWGDVIRDDYEWNHFDEINQIFGLRSRFSANPPSVYRAQANRLKNQGL